jgi:two-component system response regulator YesN
VKILAVDDQKIVLDLIRSQVDCQVLGIDELDIVTSADAAREKYREYKYEIMLCDIEMPAEDGLSLAKWVNEFSSDTKIIFLTSHADFNYVKEAISIHGFEYLLQPVSKDDLERVLQNAIMNIICRKKNECWKRREAFISQEKKRF